MEAGSGNRKLTPWTASTEQTEQTWNGERILALKPSSWGASVQIWESMGDILAQTMMVPNLGAWKSQSPKLLGLIVEEGPFPTKIQGRWGFHWGRVSTTHLNLFNLELSFGEMRSHLEVVLKWVWDLHVWWSPQGTALSSRVEFSGLQQHLPILLKLTESQSSVRLRPRSPEQSGSCCFFQQVSQTQKLFGLRSSTSLLLCAREVKQRVDPSAFSQMNKRKGLNFKIFRKIATAKKSMPKLWSSLIQDSPWAKPQGMFDDMKKASSIDFTASLHFQAGEICVRAEWSFFYNAIQICSH